MNSLKFKIVAYSYGILGLWVLIFAASCFYPMVVFRPAIVSLVILILCIRMFRVNRFLAGASVQANDLSISYVTFLLAEKKIVLPLTELTQCAIDKRKLFHQWNVVAITANADTYKFSILDRDAKKQILELISPLLKH